jgi:hypothetical protein
MRREGNSSLDQAWMVAISFAVLQHGNSDKCPLLFVKTSNSSLRSVMGTDLRHTTGMQEVTTILVLLEHRRAGQVLFPLPAPQPPTLGGKNVFL